MPFRSKAQSRWAFSKSGEKALGGPAKVKEWADSTDYKGLPEKKSGGTLAKAALAMRKVKAP